MTIVPAAIARARTKETLSVSFKLDDGAMCTYAPKAADELARLAPGSPHRVRVDGATVTVID